MKIRHRQYPPNYRHLVVFLRPPPNAIFTYGNTIYVPDGSEITAPLYAHEEVHFKQQSCDGHYADGVSDHGVRLFAIDAWWQRYIDDLKFRFDQELEAHRVEWLTFLEKDTQKPNRARRRHVLKALAARLSGPLYGRLVTLKRAQQLIVALPGGVPSTCPDGD